MGYSLLNLVETQKLKGTALGMIRRCIQQSTGATKITESYVRAEPTNVTLSGALSDDESSGKYIAAPYATTIEMAE